MKRAQPWLAALATLLALAGCAEHAVIPPAESPGNLGTLDAAYDRSQWRWVQNPDGRELLEHTRIQKCFIDPRPDTGYNEPGFSMRREQKTFGAARYSVINVYEGKDFWIAVYQRDGAPAPALGVYADGRCREAAENILRAYETKKGPA